MVASRETKRAASTCSNLTSARSTMRCSNSARYRCQLSPRESTASCQTRIVGFGSDFRLPMSVGFSLNVMSCSGGFESSKKLRLLRIQTSSNIRSFRLGRSRRWTRRRTSPKDLTMRLVGTTVRRSRPSRGINGCALFRSSAVF